jgi:hypothetical protein
MEGSLYYSASSVSNTLNGGGGYAKIPHNSSAEELTKFLRDHSEGEHLDQLGVPLEPESDQATQLTRQLTREGTRKQNLTAWLQLK